MMVLRLLARRGGPVTVLLASFVLNGVVLAASVPVWWASRRELASALVLHGEVAVLPLAAVSAWLFVSSGRRDPLAPDGRGARSASYLLLLRIIMVVLAAVVGYLLAAGAGLVAVSILGGGSASVGRALAFGALSVVAAVTLGSCCGVLLRKWTAAPVAAGVVLLAMLIFRPSGLTATLLMWPVLGVPSFYDVRVEPFVLSTVMLCSAALAVTFALRARWGAQTSRAVDARATFRVAAAAALILVGASGMQHIQFSAGSLALASLRPADESQCAGSAPRVCVWDDNAAHAQTLASALRQIHEATKSWPTNMNGERFAEEGLDRDGGVVLMGGQTLSVYPPRLGASRGVPSFSTVAANWTFGCGGRPIDSQAMEAALSRLAGGAHALDTPTIRSMLGLPPRC